METVREWIETSSSGFLLDFYKPDELSKENPGSYFPKTSHMFFQSIVFGLFLIVVRWILERSIFNPVGVLWGIKDKKVYKIADIPELEKAYNLSKTLPHKTVQTLMKKTSLTERQIQIWIRKRYQRDAPSTMQRFCESSWNCVILSIFGAYGVYALWDKPWFAKAMYCWIGWPNHHVTTDMYWYYLIELGFYWSTMFMITVDHKRKDSTEMTIHHLITISLLLFSWCNNFIRFGALVLVVHDAADSLLAAAKMSKYCEKERLTECIYYVFMVVWVSTRLIIFPYVLLYSTDFEIFQVDEPMITLVRQCWQYKIFNVLLHMLLILHFFWTYIIIKAAYLQIIQGEIKDIRSDSEEGNSEGGEKIEDEINRNSDTNNGYISQNNVK
ncbi:ceramide synthase 5-like [Mytilus trossulus]|uniref:ceramide synthase 5-like n=1 Tax=Mytilus trossulus TaxID=6551 RepID=UPI0030046135